MGLTRFSGPVMYSGQGGTQGQATGSWWQNMPIGLVGNPDYTTWWDDFNQETLITGNYTASALGGGAAAVQQGGTLNGMLGLTATNTNPSGSSIESNDTWIGSTNAHAGKTLFWESTVSVDNILQSNFFGGLATAGFTLSNTVPFGSNNQVGFKIANGSGNLLFTVDSGGTRVDYDTGIDMVNLVIVGDVITNQRKIGFKWQGAGTSIDKDNANFGNIAVYVDRKLRWVISSNTAATGAWNVTTQTASAGALMPSIALANVLASTNGGNAAANDSFVDYLLCASMRSSDGGLMTYGPNKEYSSFPSRDTNY